jgi:hypothetical protein
MRTPKTTIIKTTIANENQKTYNYSQLAIGNDNSLPENNLVITRSVFTHNMA